MRFEHGNPDVTLSKVLTVLAELDLLVRVDPARSASDPQPRLVIPDLTAPELRIDQAKLSRVRESIRFLEAGTTNGER